MRLSWICLMIACGNGNEASPKPQRPPRDLGPASHDACVAASRGGLASPGGTGLGADADAQLRTHREPIILRRCTEDAWPTDAARCFAIADGLREIGDCLMLLPTSDKLTAELQAQMHLDLHLP